jgi:hypothetical protein
MDANAVLSASVASQLFQAISWWKTEIAQILCGIQYEKFTQCGSMNLMGQLLRPLTLKELLGI